MSLLLRMRLATPRSRLICFLIHLSRSTRCDPESFCLVAPDLAVRRARKSGRERKREREAGEGKESRKNVRFVRKISRRPETQGLSGREITIITCTQDTYPLSLSLSSVHQPSPTRHAVERPKREEKEGEREQRLRKRIASQSGKCFALLIRRSESKPTDLMSGRERGSVNHGADPRERCIK